MKLLAPLLARVFWPDLGYEEEEVRDRSSAGFIVGWNVSEFTCCVLTITSSERERDLVRSLELLAVGGYLSWTFAACWRTRSLKKCTDFLRRRAQLTVFV